MRRPWVTLLVALSLGLLGASVAGAQPTPLTPVIGVDPTALDFGRVCQGQSRDLTIDLFNNVSDPTSILTITALATSGAPFTLVGPPSLPLTIPGDGVTRVPVTVRYTPSAGGAQNGTFTVTALPPVTGPNPVDVPLSGLGNRAPLCNAGGPYTGQVGQAVSFNGGGSSDPDGDPITYSWDFGDGSSGTGATPTHTYATGGVFTVTLTVNDGCTSSQCSTTADINAPPICDAAGPYTGNVGQAVSFDGTGSSDPDGTIATYAWNFGDGGTGTGATPSHTYATGGLFTVTLTVTDNDGASSNCETTADINTPPICDADGPYSGTVGQPVSFDGTGSSDPDGTIVAYVWNFGDGSTGTGATPTHTYATGGVFTVSLMVTDNDGASSSCQTTADINTPPTCDAGGPYSGTIGQPVQFDGTGSTDPDGTIASYAWSFGDGSTGTGATPTHTYATGGVFAVTLTVTDNDGASSTCETTADINTPPVCDANGPYSGTAGQSITFDGTGSSDPDGTITSYAWNFGDGGTGSGPNPTHTYATGGTFAVTLAVTDDDSASSTCETTADINSPPVCDADGPYNGTVNVAVQFDGTGSSDPDGTIASYAWDFGDGGTGTGASPTHTYATAGNFTVTLIVTDNEGASSTCTTTANITETPNEPPLCDANGPYSGTAGVPVSFDGSNSSDPDGTIVSYEWDFGDSGTGTGATPTHTYATAGTFTVSLTVTDDDGGSSSCTTIADITAAPNDPPICDANGPYSGQTGVPVTFDGTGSSDPDGTIVSYEWDFGDGSTGTGATPTHTYAAAGTFLVELCVTDDDTAQSCCETSATITDAPNLPPVCDANGPYTGDVGTPIAFDGSGSSDPDGVIVTYAWDFGDGETGTGATPSHTYAAAGSFIATLCVTDDDSAQSCCDSDVTVLPPSAVEIASFTATAGGGVVTVAWTTSFEEENLGFYVERAEAGTTTFTRLNPTAMVEAHGDGNQSGVYTYLDRTVEPGHTYVYQLVALDRGSNETRVGTTLEVAVSHAAPTRLALNQNHPNPFNPTTTISFALPEAGHVTLRIYDAQGHLVRTLVDEERAADFHVAEWDGKDDAGTALGSGVYLYRLETRASVLQQKMVLMK
jgi:PKD repeat protein